GICRLGPRAIAASLGHPEQREQFTEADYHLAVPFGQVNPALGNKGIGGRELGQHEPADGKLRQGENTNPELRDAHHPAAELANSDYPAGYHWHAVGPELKRDVDKRQPGEGELRLVFVAPAVEGSACRIGCSALWAGEGFL